MRADPTIALVTQQPATTSAVGAALSAAGNVVVRSACADLDELADHLRETPVAAALVDVDPDPAHTFGRLTPIVSRFPDTRFIALADTVDSQVMLMAMEAGARHVLAKSAIADDLSAVLDRLVGADSAPSGLQGTIATVLSASGGCGATTVAINLVNELHESTQRSALLVDMDCHFGVADSYLGLRGDYGLADVLAHPTGLDPDLVRSTAIDYHDAFSLLRSPAVANLPAEEALNAEQVMAVTHACASAYEYTVFDAPRVPMSIAAELAAASSLTLVILQMSVKDLRVVRSMLAALSRLTGGTGRILPVVNRYSKRGTMISAEETGKVLGCEYAVISNDYRSTIRSINFGQTLQRVAPRSPCRRDIQNLARRVIERSEKPQRAGANR